MKDPAAILNKFASQKGGPLALVLARPSFRAWFMISAGAIFALAGANTILDTFGKFQAVDLEDPIFGVRFRHLLLMAGLAELFVAWLCLFPPGRGSSQAPKRLASSVTLILVAWLAVDFVAYRAAIWSKGWPHPWVFVSGLANAWSISPLAADSIIVAGALYLLAGSLALLLIPQGSSEMQPQREAEFKMSCPACGAHIKFDTRDFGRKIPCPLCRAAIALRAPANLKMSCSACKEHIEFPSHALGQKISCPHCHMNIILKESEQF